MDNSWFDLCCGCCNSRSHLENKELKAEYLRLQESYRELEQMKDSLEDTKAACQLNLTDAQKESEKTHTEVFTHTLSSAIFCFCLTRQVLQVMLVLQKGTLRIVE